MSRVFVAEDVRLERKVVLKVLPDELAAGVNVERFEREIRLAARLQHPHIVPLLTAGSADGMPYYVMPYVEGESLRARITREGELPVAEATRILREVLDALEYAHRHGVVHRDIKPENVLLTGGHAVVTDFGVAKALSDATGDVRLTATGLALGTPAYMAPEQIAGESNVDHRADVYAAGALAFEMICGVQPFRGATTQAILAAHMTQAPPSLSTLRQTIPPMLDTIVQGCLQKRPADRWQTAGEIIPQLDTIATPAAQASSGGAFPPLPNVESSPHPVRVGALFLLASVGVLALIWLLVRWLGLPDWVFQGAIALLVAGLPIMLLTSHREKERAAAGNVATPAGVGRLFTWRRSIQGGLFAFAALALSATGFMASRALGVGPGATLVSSGVLTPRDRILIADFANRTSDSTLGLTITQLLRIDLAQSTSISVMEPSQVADVLTRMQRDRSTPVTEEVAREVAAREGSKAYLAGEILPAGSGFVIVARLVNPTTGDALVSLREAVASSDKLVHGVDKLSAKLREKVGESLRSVRTDPPLEQVTTSSLNAIRLYAEALRVNDREGPDRALGILEQAVAEDSNFAMGWRRYGAWATNTAAGPLVRAKGVSALRRAYALRERLTERERYAVEAMYYTVVEVDLERAASAWASAVEKYPNDVTALNNIGVTLDRLGRSDEALAKYLHAIAVPPTPALTYVNAMFAAGFIGRLTTAESVLTVYRRDYPGTSLLNEATIRLASIRQDFHAVDTLAQMMLRRTAYEQTGGHQYLSMTAELRGRMDEASRETRSALRMEVARGQISDEDAAILAELADIRRAAEYSIERRDLLQRLRALWERNRVLTANRPPLLQGHDLFAPVFAQLGETERARQLIQERMDSLTRKQYPAMAARTRDYVLAAQALTASGQPEEALARIREGCNLLNNVVALCDQMAFLEVAQAHDRAGRADSALAAYRRFVELKAMRYLGPPGMIDVTTPKLAPVWRRLGELYESKGDRKNAIEAYEHFLDYWRNADPNLQPIVRDVRTRTDRLRRATG